MTRDELYHLRQRVKRQRAELRRLNAQLQSFWHGWAYHGYVTRELEYRSKMIRAFGIEAVCRAERVESSAGERT